MCQGMLTVGWGFIFGQSSGSILTTGHKQERKQAEGYGQRGLLSLRVTSKRMLGEVESLGAGKKTGTGHLSWRRMVGQGKYH